jgi:hypothetical protein
LTDQTLSDAKSLGDDVVAVSVHVVDELEDDLREQWERWNPGVQLVQLDSQYHSVIQPIVDFVRSRSGKEDERIVVLIPEIVPEHFWENVIPQPASLHAKLGVTTKD